MRLKFTTELTGPAVRDEVLINLKKQAISVTINTFTVYTFDLGGRLITAFADNHLFRRGLDNRVMEKWSTSTGSHRQHIRRWLGPHKKRSLLARIHEHVRLLHRALRQGDLHYASSEAPIENAKETILRALEKILHYDAASLEANAAKFADVYRPIGILPPDMYQALVVQATEGCSYNRCNYCHFYKDQAFRVKSVQEFRRHVRNVKSYLGPSVALRKFVFLGEANALDLPSERLIPFFDTLNQELTFAGQSGRFSEEHGARSGLKGIYGFASALPARVRTAKEFEELRARRLQRVYIGLETGSEALLKFLDKPVNPENAVRLVEAIKHAGVSVGVIILLGAGGEKFFKEHIQETAKVVNAMRLGTGDMVYFSPLSLHGQTGYARRMAETGARALTWERSLQQREEIIGALRFADRSMPKIAEYNIEDFIY